MIRDLRGADAPSHPFVDRDYLSIAKLLNLSVNVAPVRANENLSVSIPLAAALSFNTLALTSASVPVASRHEWNPNRAAPASAPSPLPRKSPS